MKTAYEYTQLCVQKYLDLTLSTTEIWYDPHTLIDALDSIRKKAFLRLSLESKDSTEWTERNIATTKIDLSALEGQNYIIDCVLEDLKES